MRFRRLGGDNVGSECVLERLVRGNRGVISVGTYGGTDPKALDVGANTSGVHRRHRGGSRDRYRR